MSLKFTKTLILHIILLIFLNSCFNIKEQERSDPKTAYEKAREAADKNPISLGDFGKKGGTNFEFASSNILWRATLTNLNFIPLANVDYSGGVIITDWYSENNAKEQIKIQIRFLSNELRSDALQINSFKRSCDTNGLCKNLNIDSNFNNAIKEAILNTARVMKIEETKKK